MNSNTNKKIVNSTKPIAQYTWKPGINPLIAPRIMASRAGYDQRTMSTSEASINQIYTVLISGHPTASYSCLMRTWAALNQKPILPSPSSISWLADRSHHSSRTQLPISAHSAAPHYACLGYDADFHCTTILAPRTYLLLREGFLSPELII